MPRIPFPQGHDSGAKREHPTYVSFQGRFMDNLVNVVCCDAGPDLLSSYIEDLSSKPAGFPHAVLLLLVENLDVVPTHELPLGPRYSIIRVVWMWYRRRYRSLWR